MNPLYQRLTGGAPTGVPTPSFSGGMQFQNPIQKMQYIMQAMQNPAAFVRNAFPDIPGEIQHDPNRILQYLQQSRGITDDQIRQVQNQMPKF